VGEQILTDSERKLGCMLVDMGAETTTVSIYKDGALLYLVTLPLGGRNLTRDVMQGLNVLEETAENVKKNINNPLDPSTVSDVVIEGVRASDASNYISARMGEIIANINQQLANAGVSADSIQSIVLIGGSAHLGGLAQKLGETMKMRVRLGQNPSSIRIQSGEYNKMEYIEVFSLLAKAADAIDLGDTCVELNNYSNAFEVNVNQSQQPTGQQPAAGGNSKPEAKSGSKKQPSNRWAKLRGMLQGLMTEDEENE